MHLIRKQHTIKLLIDLKEDIDIKTLVEDFNTALTLLNRSLRVKLRKDILVLLKEIKEERGLVSVHRAFHLHKVK